MLTTEDIEQKTFSTALRGYDLNEVDDFLDEIMATIRDLNEKLEAARAGQPIVESTAAAVPAAAVVAVDESAVGRALVAAQEAADRILSEAQAEAERIKDEARQEADSWVTERDQARADAEKEMADLSNRVAAVRRELAVLATGVADGLDSMDAAIAGAEPVARHASVAGVEDPDVSWDSEDVSPSDTEEAGPAEEGEDDDASADDAEGDEAEGSPDESAGSSDSEDSEDSEDGEDDQPDDDSGSRY